MGGHREGRGRELLRGGRNLKEGAGQSDGGKTGGRK